MKDELDILFSRDESDIENIAENYPAAGQREKEKIYDICKRKYNTQKSEDKETDGYIKQAEGVETYKRPKLYRFLSAAAAIVIVAGGIGGYAFMKNRHGNNFGAGNTQPVQIEPGVPQEFIDELNAVTDELLSKLERYEAFHYGVGVDKEDCFTGSISLMDNPAFDAQKIDLKYCRVTDKELGSYENMMAFSKSFLTEELSSTDFVSVKDDEDDKDKNISVIFSKPIEDNKIGCGFIGYNDLLYSRDNSSEEHSVNLTEFSKYELISSEFYDENDAGERTALLGYGSDIIKCDRVYKKSDGRLVTIILDIVKENDGNGVAWKIDKWDISEKDSEGEVLTRKKSKNSFNPKDIESVTTADAEGEFADLQLHELKIYHSREEADKAYDEACDAYYNNKYEFKKVNVEKYADQLLSAANADELNTLENKSYIYHINANQFHYYDTALAKYCYEEKQPNINIYEEHESIIDNRQLYYYSKTIDYDSESERVIVDIVNEKERLQCFPTEKMYYKNENREDYRRLAGAYIPDNDRVAHMADYEFEDKTIAWELGKNFEELNNYCSFVALSNFEKWYIDGVEQFLGRDCAHIILTLNNGFGETTCERWIDIRTGIVLKSSIKSDEFSQIVEFTELKLNEPVEKIDYDLTGYTLIDDE